MPRIVDYSNVRSIDDIKVSGVSDPIKKKIYDRFVSVLGDQWNSVEEFHTLFPEYNTNYPLAIPPIVKANEQTGLLFDKSKMPAARRIADMTNVLFYLSGSASSSDDRYKLAAVDTINKVFRTTNTSKIADIIFDSFRYLIKVKSGAKDRAIQDLSTLLNTKLYDCFIKYKDSLMDQDYRDDFLETWFEIDTTTDFDDDQLLEDPVFEIASDTGDDGLWDAWKALVALVSMCVDGDTFKYLPVPKSDKLNFEKQRKLIDDKLAKTTDKETIQSLQQQKKDYSPFQTYTIKDAIYDCIDGDFNHKIAALTAIIKVFYIEVREENQ